MAALILTIFIATGAIAWVTKHRPTKSERVEKALRIKNFEERSIMLRKILMEDRLTRSKRYGQS
jgi:hypothetical protein